MPRYKRKKMTFYDVPRNLEVRVMPEVFFRLHERAAKNGRSLNLEVNEIISAAIDSRNN